MDVLAIEARNDIADLDPRQLGRAIVRHPTDQHTSGIVQFELFGEPWRQVLSLDPKIATHYVSIRHQVGHYSAGKIRRNGKADAQVSPRAAENRGVNADELSRHIDK